MKNLSCIDKIKLPCGSNLLVKRDDLIDPCISGNKWRKLFGQLTSTKQYQGILTFGGPFSNHILATAAFAKKHQLPAIGMIRTRDLDDENPTMRLSKKLGMRLIPLAPNRYEQKTNQRFLEELKTNYPNYLIIPEGGSNAQALLGFKNLWQEIITYEHKIDTICVAWGTGSTAIGITKYKPPHVCTAIYPALKGINTNTIHETFNHFHVEERNSICNPLKHLPRFGKVNQDLMKFATTIYLSSGLLLDPLYTLKMLYQIEQNNHLLNYGNTLLYHSGGIQGWGGIFYLKPHLRLEYPEIFQAFRDYQESMIQSH